MTGKKTYPRLETIPIAKLKAHPDGVREHGSDALYLLLKCRKALGMLRVAVVLNVRTGNVLDGDLWIEALRMEGEEEVDVWCVDVPEDMEDIAHLALQNHAGEWQWQKVSETLKLLQSKQQDLRLTGFHEYDIGPLTAADWTPPAKGPMDGTDAAQSTLL